MRLSQLLTLVHNEFTAPILTHPTLSSTGYDGLCRVTENLYRFNIITRGEKVWVMGYISVYCPATNIFEYGWEPYKKRPRKRWLKRHIRMLRKRGL
jgi:hypothetical protein